MGGQGATADPDGNLSVISGNGDFDGVQQFGESFLKMKYTPASAGNAASLKIIDHWTPWTDMARSGGVKPPANKLAGVSNPSDAMSTPVGGGMKMNLRKAKVEGEIGADGKLTVRWCLLRQRWRRAMADEDWGSAGPACIFFLRVCIATGKDGIGYPIKTTNMGWDETA